MIRRLLVLADSVTVRTKIMGIVVGLILLVGLGATYELQYHMASILGQELDARAISIARDLAARSSDQVLTNNTYGLYQLVEDTLNNNPDVRYVMVMGPDGRPLVTTFGSRVPAGLTRANQVAPQDRQHLEILSTDEGLIRDVAVPIFEGHAGTARVGLSDIGLQKELDAATRGLLLMTGVVSLVGLGAAYLLTLILTRPISDLVKVARRVERGDLTAQTRPRTRDEIGVLGHAFNSMVQSLSRSQAESREYNERLLRRNRELAALNLMTSAVSQARTLQEVLDTALNRSLQLASLEAGWIWLLEEDGDSLRLGAHTGLSENPPIPEVTHLTPGCSCRAVIETRQVLSTETSPDHCPMSNIGPFHEHIGVPLVAKGRALGVMNLASLEPREFSREELDILGAIGSQIGVAIENARLWEELLRKQELQHQLLNNIIGAQEDERKRIARELHDETSQVLTSIVLGLEGLEGERCLTDEARERAARLRSVTSRALEEVHHLSLELRPSALDDAGLVPGITRYLREYAARQRQDVDFRSIGTEGLRLLPAAETAVFRIVQEALTNVARHARAHGVSVLLERRGPNLVTVVEDDGCGFAPDAVAAAPLPERLGLAGMSERAALVGGHLTIESQPGEGTTVFVTVPLTDNLLVRKPDEQAPSIAG